VCMRDHISNILRSIASGVVAVLHAHVRQTVVCRPVYRETLRIVDVPMEDVEVVLVKHSQQFEDSLNGEKLPACVEHEASMRVQIGRHFG
jgi:hypothetical protein